MNAHQQHPQHSTYPTRQDAHQQYPQHSTYPTRQEFGHANPNPAFCADDACPSMDTAKQFAEPQIAAVVIQVLPRVDEFISQENQEKLKNTANEAGKDVLKMAKAGDIVNFRAMAAENSKKWCVAEPSGTFTIMIGYSIIAYTYKVNMFDFIPMIDEETGDPVLSLFWRLLLIFMCNFLTIMTLWSHFKAMTTNPGTIAKNGMVVGVLPEKQEGAGAKYDRANDCESGEHCNPVNGWCDKCDQIKPERAHHCRICKRCVNKMDHHCPWVNNCVGQGNMKFFMLYNFYVSALSWFSLLHLCLCHGWISFQENSVEYSGDLVFKGNTLFGICVLFALFTGGMFCGMICSNMQDKTQIEEYKERKRMDHMKYAQKADAEAIQAYVKSQDRNRSFSETMEDLSGIGTFHWIWFAPIHLQDAKLAFKLLAEKQRELNIPDLPGADFVPKNIGARPNFAM